MENETGRGSGKTYRQIRAVPDGGLFIVPASGVAGHCRAILQQQGRRPTALRIVDARIVERNSDMLFSSANIGCDHLVELTPKLKHALLAASHSASVRWPDDIPEPQPGDPIQPSAEVVEKLLSAMREPPAVTLLREAAARFREYEAHHRDAAEKLGDTIEREDRDRNAERNADMAGQIEAFLAERDRLMEKPEPKPEGGFEL